MPDDAGDFPFDNHHVVGIPLHHPLHLLQDSVQHPIQIQRTAQRGSRLRQRFGQSPLLLLLFEKPRVLHRHRHLIGKGAQEQLLLLPVGPRPVALDTEHPDRPPPDPHRDPQPRGREFHRSPENRRGGSPFNLRPVPDQQRLPLGDYDRHQPFPQGAPPGRLTDPVVHQDPKVQLPCILIVEGDEKGIEGEDGHYLPINRLQQLIQPQDATCRPGNPVDRLQPFRPAMGLVGLAC